MWKWKSKTEPSEIDPKSNEIVNDIEKIRAAHRWSGQGFCHKCGEEMEKDEISSRDDYDPFTGKSLGTPVQVLVCPNLVLADIYGWMRAVPTGRPRRVGGKYLWNLSTHRYIADHDFWFYESGA